MVSEQNGSTQKTGVEEVEATTPSQAMEPKATSSKERKALSRAKKHINLLKPFAVKKLVAFLLGKCGSKNH